MSSRKIERRIHHYKSCQMILTVGDGDFSFSACLAKAFCSAHNMVATSLDSLDTLVRKYGSFEGHCRELENRGCQMLFEVDVHDMDKHPTLLAMKFDVIIFNFPHAGHVSWLCENDTILIERHKKLLRGFFRSAREMVKKGGEVHVAHRDDEPYCRWELEKQARIVGLALKEKTPFAKEDYPGYHPKRGGDILGNKPFPLDLRPYTFKFTCVVDYHDHDQGVTPIATSLIASPASGDRAGCVDGEIKVLIHDDIADETRDLQQISSAGIVIVEADSDQEILADSGVRVGGILGFFRGALGCLFGLMSSYNIFSVLGLW